MRRSQILTLVGIGTLAGGVAAAIAVLLPWLPTPASREAGRIDFVFWFVTIICIVIFAIVAAVLLYAVVRFRAAPDDDSDGPPTHGHTGLEIVWTIIPTILVTTIGVVSAVVLAKNDHAPKGTLHINVTAQQFVWSFSYPTANNMTVGELHVPVDQSILLTFTSKDVIHSFWVPEWGQKEDTVPGIHPTLHITPDRIGRFPVICTELCGLGHSTMRTWAIVQSKADYDKWLHTNSTATGSSNPATAGAAVFKNNGCGACHTLAAAGASGKVGPDLDKLPAEAQQAKQPLDPFVRTSIVDPNAYIQPGFPKNVMPQTFKSLPKPQLDALVQYLIQSSKKG
jgi:cytochrome c oxidase subunit 2